MKDEGPEKSPAYRKPMAKESIGKVTGKPKIAAGLFWADYGELGAQVKELTAGGVDWIHLEMRDGAYCAASE